MGWIRAATTFSYDQRSKCADLPELLPKRSIYEKNSESAALLSSGNRRFGRGAWDASFYGAGQRADRAGSGSTQAGSSGSRTGRAGGQTAGRRKETEGKQTGSFGAEPAAISGEKNSESKIRPQSDLHLWGNGDLIRRRRTVRKSADQHRRNRICMGRLYYAYAYA